MSNITQSKNWKAPSSWEKAFSEAILEVADEVNVTGTLNSKKIACLLGCVYKVTKSLK